LRKRDEKADGNPGPIDMTGEKFIPTDFSRSRKNRNARESSGKTAAGRYEKPRIGKLATNVPLLRKALARNVQKRRIVYH
jgi:hypothetical protein